jgi:hypothetical protein
MVFDLSLLTSLCFSRLRLPTFLQNIAPKLIASFLSTSTGFALIVSLEISCCMHDVVTCFFFVVEATDAKGEAIHQTLMPKKMQRLDESPDFRPFKFRIQAFTNAFLEEASHF